MSVRYTQVFPKEDINEYTMIEACAGLYDQSYFKFRNFYYRYDYEADLFVISKARYATEIEVKISLADWKADLVKKKHQSHKELKHFYYAVPEALADKAPVGIDERYGLIVVNQKDNEERMRAKIVKSAHALGGSKVGKYTICKAFVSVYYRQFKLIEANRFLRRELAQLKMHLPT